MSLSLLFRAPVRFSAAVLTAAALFTAPALAHEVKVGSLALTDLWTRATPPKAPTAGGYLTITNTGSEADTLVSASTPLAEKGEIHLMETKDGVMTMKPVEGGIALPAGESVALAPGGYHLMFLGMKEPIVEGGKMPVTLTFAKAGTIETFLHILAIGSAGPDGTATTTHEAH
jgi:copper(I)-binding protein